MATVKDMRDLTARANKKHGASAPHASLYHEVISVQTCRMPEDLARSAVPAALLVELGPPAAGLANLFERPRRLAAGPASSPAPAQIAARLASCFAPLQIAVARAKQPGQVAPVVVRTISAAPARARPSASVSAWASAELVLLQGRPRHLRCPPVPAAAGNPSPNPAAHRSPRQAHR
jgi:hypothetical protein